MPMEIFRGIATKEFIERRDEIILEESKKPKNRFTKVPLWWKWDCEFPEHHQALLEGSGHELYNGFEYDTIHDVYGNTDFKYYSNKGALISNYIQLQVKKGIVDTIALWNWEVPQHTKIQENEEVGYAILAYIDAKFVLQNLVQNRFTFPANYDII